MKTNPTEGFLVLALMACIGLFAYSWVTQPEPKALKSEWYCAQTEVRHNDIECARYERIPSYLNH